ncbi:MAG: DEAD/DEAH box helicase [Phycisphaerales bacterium]
MPTAQLVQPKATKPQRSTSSERETTRRKPRRRTKSIPPKLDRHAAPADMTLEQWQAGLRRQFGREQAFELANLGVDPIFSEFRVVNPASGGAYRVVIRGSRLGENSCTCPDFATNALGTCKHIEVTLGRLERRRGAKAALERGHQPPFNEIVLRHGARRDVVFRPGTECPRALRALAANFFDDAGVLREGRHADLERFLAEAERRGHRVRVGDDALGFVAEVRDAESRRTRIRQAFPRGVRTPALRRLVRTTLYEYQCEGALFAATAGRCLIGDEMGLGKTVQAIAATEIMAKHLGVERVLVVCPTSLKHQWAREIARFTTRTATVIGGGRGRRRERFAEASFFKLTNYDTIHNDLDLIAAWSPDLVILDEAQRIKNWSTRAARSVKRIVSPYAIVLTGTPLENRLEELVSIVDFVDRHRLGPTYRLLANHQIRDPDSGRVVGYRGLDAIGRTLAPILIRRRKKDVALQLPERIDKTWFVPMTPEQVGLHQENAEIVAKIAARWRRFHFLSEADRRRLLVALQNMRMSCDSSYLLDQSSEHGTKPEELATLLEEILEDRDAKVVVFSQWVRMHELLIRRLAARRIEHVFFHGGVTNEQRAGLVDRFRADPACRVFLSTDAGGVGLNLQHASVVVNMDLPWNPAILEQRIGRVHRLGQSRPVQVFNFVSKGGIEEGMLDLLKFKKSLFTGALDGESSEVFLGGSSLSRFMQTVEKATAGIAVGVEEDEGDEEAESSEAAASIDGAVAGDISNRTNESATSGAASTIETTGDGATWAPSSFHEEDDFAPATQPQAAASSVVSDGVIHRHDRPEQSPAEGSAATSGSTPSDSTPSAGDDPARLPTGMPVRAAMAPTAPPSSATSSAVHADLASLLQQGLVLLAPLIAPSEGAVGGDPSASTSPTAARVVRRDPTTGESYLHLPVPKSEVLETMIAAATRLLERMRGGG